jgi:hypothetical protein
MRHFVNAVSDRLACLSLARSLPLLVVERRSHGVQVELCGGGESVGEEGGEEDEMQTVLL